MNNTNQTLKAITTFKPCRHYGFYFRHWFKQFFVCVRCQTVFTKKQIELYKKYDKPSIKTTIKKPKTIIRPSLEDEAKINDQIHKVTDCFIRFNDFQNIEIEGRLTLEEWKKVAEIIETAEAWLALESKPLTFDE